MKFTLISLFGLILLNYVSCQFNNPNGTIVNIAGKDYYFGQFTDVTFDEAMIHCDDQGMILASFETIEENDAVQSYITTNPDNELDFWMWTSGKREAGTTNWMWMGTNVAITSVDWIQNGIIPDRDVTLEACINFSATGGGWDDDDCTRKMSFLCEAP